MSRRRRKRRSSKLILWIGLGVLIAGFLARRMLMPRALNYLRHRPTPSDRVSRPSRGDTRENLSDADRRQLDAVLRSKRK